MEIKYKAFRELNNGTLQAVYAPTIYKVGKVKIFRKCPAFVCDSIFPLWNMISANPGLSIWEVAVDGKVKLPEDILPVKELTPKKIYAFWNGKRQGSLANGSEYGYLKIKPIRKLS